VTDYQYYNALVCACGGQIDDINTELQNDYEELVVEFARTEVAG
jgi:translation initiation factor 1 (eIF-1/SUI1)